MQEDTNNQIAIAASRSRKNNGYAPEGPKETERIEREFTSIALTLLVSGSALVGSIGIISLMTGIMSSGGIPQFFHYFMTALTGN
jgi:hypothetical protein